MPEIQLEVDPASFLISLFALGVSLWAVGVTRASHRKSVRREEFTTYREAVSAERSEFAKCRLDVARLVEPTVPIEAIVVGFDGLYPILDKSIRAITDILSDIDAAGLFGAGWRASVEASVETWQAEFDCVMSSQRTEIEKREAAVRCVAALVAFQDVLDERVRGIVREHAT